MSDFSIFTRPIAGDSGDRERIRLDGCSIRVHGGGRSVSYVRATEEDARELFERLYRERPGPRPCAQRIDRRPRNDPAYRFDVP